ncbi:class I SAM-dependent methyltransferase [Sandaracinus amylolyticus]|uniref:class I SAM-dependent methyltransferase n=1 Tax=Sandaracinus amylolyticus TaxID=927083 RepID=UPI001F2B5815|nr:methyltransferase domain-containing protein [Sandaracinus amylolyticus]UJR82107.1 Phospholipid N-methyltransferase [Sandaracinus amylolyticus]
MKPDPRAFWTFFRQGFAKWDQTASFVPSQRFLVDAMVNGAEPERARRIVELGPGVGVMTKPLLSRMRDDAELYTIEIDPPIHEQLVRAVVDPRLHPICGSAEHIADLLAEKGCSEKVDAVVSSLGMSLIPPAVRDRIVESIIDSLAPGGVYVQFGYIHTRYLVISTERGFVPFDYLGYLESRFERVQRTPVPLNFPPAWVFESRKPR